MASHQHSYENKAIFFELLSFENAKTTMTGFRFEGDPKGYDPVRIRVEADLDHMDDKYSYASMTKKFLISRDGKRVTIPSLMSLFFTTRSSSSCMIRACKYLTAIVFEKNENFRRGATFHSRIWEYASILFSDVPLFLGTVLILLRKMPRKAVPKAFLWSIEAALKLDFEKNLTDQCKIARENFLEEQHEMLKRSKVDLIDDLHDVVVNVNYSLLLTQEDHHEFADYPHFISLKTKLARVLSVMADLSKNE